jgi:hypothetical protein
MFKKFLITILISLGLGILAIVPIVNSQNGYVAGYLVLPLMLLIGIGCLILFIIGIALLINEKKIGLYFLLAVILLPTGFIGSALIAKRLELGAYREDPMVPLIPELSNIVLLNKGVTNDEINAFWNETLSTQRDDGRGHTSLPGIHGIGRLSAKEDHEVIEFSFFTTATEEQREYVYAKVSSSPIVFKLLKNVPTKDFMPTPEIPSNDNRPKKEIRITNETRQ